MSEAVEALNYLRLHRDCLLSDAAQWTAAALSHRPRAGAWSALEVIDHLRRTEQWAAREIRMATQRQWQRTVRTTPAQLVLFTIMRSPLRVKVPEGSEELHPSPPESLAMAADNWFAAGEQLELSLGRLSQDQRNLAVMRHPIGGWMNATTASRFLKVHLQHHLRQWERLRVASA